MNDPRLAATKSASTPATSPMPASPTPDGHRKMATTAPTASPEGWTTIITPHRGWLDWRLHQLWRYRDLISLFVWRDYVSAYKQTILGPAWHIIQPLFTTLTFTVMFGKIAKLPTNGISPF